MAQRRRQSPINGFAQVLGPFRDSVGAAQVEAAKLGYQEAVKREDRRYKERQQFDDRVFEARQQEVWNVEFDNQQQEINDTVEALNKGQIDLSLATGRIAKIMGYANSINQVRDQFESELATLEETGMYNIPEVRSALLEDVRSRGIGKVIETGLPGNADLLEQDGSSSYLIENEVKRKAIEGLPQAMTNEMMSDDLTSEGVDGRRLLGQNQALVNKMFRRYSTPDGVVYEVQDPDILEEEGVINYLMAMPEMKAIIRDHANEKYGYMDDDTIKKSVVDLFSPLAGGEEKLETDVLDEEMRDLKLRQGEQQIEASEQRTAQGWKRLDLQEKQLEGELEGDAAKAAEGLEEYATEQIFIDQVLGPSTVRSRVGNWLQSYIYQHLKGLGQVRGVTIDGNGHVAVTVYPYDDGLSDFDPSNETTYVIDTPSKAATFYQKIQDTSKSFNYRPVLDLRPGSTTNNQGSATNNPVPSFLNK